jgi:hypothetical protein
VASLAITESVKNHSVAVLAIFRRSGRTSRIADITSPVAEMLQQLSQPAAQVRSAGSQDQPITGRERGWRRYRWRLLASDHNQIDPAVFKALPCQTIPCHFLDSVPVLTKIARSLVLG